MFLPAHAICLCGLEFKLASLQVCQVWHVGPQHGGRVGKLGLLPACGRFGSSAAFFSGTLVCNVKNPLVWPAQAVAQT